MSSCSNNETLLDLVVRGRWSALVSRAETHPEELAEIGDEDGMTVFHWMCANDAPPRTLRALLLRDELRALRGHDRAVLIPDLNGITPLMSACARGSSKEHVKLLVESAPESIPLVDNDGWTALHFLCHNVRIKRVFGEQVLPILFSRTEAENRELAFLRDIAGNNTPLSLACDAFGVTEALLRERHPTRTSVGHDPVFCLAFVNSFLDLLHPPEHKSWPFMTRLLGFPGIPMVFVDVALLFHCGAKLLEVNDDGDSPLHVVVSRSWETGLVKRVVDACPCAASLRNRRGLLPLQVALTTSNQHWNEDFSALVEAYPASLEVVELNDSIYPHILERMNRQPASVFGILKSKPTLVQRRIR